MKRKRLLSLALAAVTAVGALGMSGCGESEESDNTFGWWIYATDGQGTYYTDYDDNPAVQWMNHQTWDVENGGIAKDGDGAKVTFTFQAPIAGSETDNFNTMMSTGEYPELIDLNVAESAETLVEEGILVDITEYVEKYMPNYQALLEKYPDIKGKVTNVDEDGNVHYYKLCSIYDGMADPWAGYVYRRDWLVKYATPTEYVWDWDSDYVKENGHPAVTPLSEAQASGNMEGWKKNEVTSFTMTQGEDPDNDWQDNVIFPSGKDYPYTISDWEWMLEAYQKAIEERGWSEDSNAYGTTVSYAGVYSMGELASSFGGGGMTWSVDEDGQVYYAGTSDNFKTYLECVNHWYEEGWLDKTFETRTADMMWMINEAGCTQGKVGMWLGTVAVLGDTIRVTCANEEDAQDAYVMGCPFPINDVYGSDEQKFKEPDAFYADSLVGAGTGFTNKIEDKSEEELAALFTALDWTYTPEGGNSMVFGLSSEQMEEYTPENNIYEEYGFTAGYDVIDNGDGTVCYRTQFASGDDTANAFRNGRMGVGLRLTGNGEGLDYTMEYADTAKVTADAKKHFAAYRNTASVMDYPKMFDDEEGDLYNKTSNSLLETISIEVPKLIKEGLGGWNDYVDAVNQYDPQAVTEILQKYVDRINAAES